jgi:hypothetical protein
MYMYTYQLYATKTFNLSTDLKWRQVINGHGLFWQKLHCIEWLYAHHSLCLLTNPILNVFGIIQYNMLLCYEFII